MNIRPLQWDSDFFRLRIGRVDISSMTDIETLNAEERILRQEYDLIYVFCPHSIKFHNVNALLVDEKTLYTKKISSKKTSQEVNLYSDVDPNEDLYRLALVSGQYSRYKIDGKFPAGSYERLYKRWIEQSTNGNLANAVFVHNTGEIIDGMITVKWNQDDATIGLVAVDTNSQSKGIGSMIMQAVESYLNDNTNVKTLTVATQWSNLKARRWYEKNGFTVESVTNIYHWWLNK